ncbi:tellurite resistance/C4-dicarboxylate transporter family protein [Mycolicibacterium stellerae]|uniref:tellurite resistance/C4-dicarboxylate transporter family protein n=1 Tax=Mycolicibacterium stellerae TaxID=2358193 RepID=UPI000F0B45E0|nr:tellurite resistance/C4-dicarboxylate transporter family protein [Mycolicibacterium stellerae]
MRPDAFAAVMATGIVSIAAADHGVHGISDVLAVIAVVVFAVLTIVAIFRLRPDFDAPDVPLQLLTFVAACAVVGTRLGWWPVGVVGLLGWLLLLPIALRAMWRCRWTGLRDRARGGWELASVATSGLAIIAADVGLVGVALGLLALAICLYCVMTGLVLWRAVHDPSQTDLFEPDVWILMGGAAIATLAGDHIHKAGFEGIRPVTVATWIVASLWIPVLVVASARVRGGSWWAAVFPLGMYSSATYATAVETGWHPLTTVSLVFFWIALAAWVLTSLRFGRAHIR